MDKTDGRSLSKQSLELLRRQAHRLQQDKHTRGSTLGLAYALWSRRTVQEAVKVKFGLDMPIRMVGEYFRRWGE